MYLAKVYVNLQLYIYLPQNIYGGLEMMQTIALMEATIYLQY
jgi:hypothetical protein